jgi:hypothetical protein
MFTAALDRDAVVQASDERHVPPSGWIGWKLVVWIVIAHGNTSSQNRPVGMFHGHCYLVNARFGRILMSAFG